MIHQDHLIIRPVKQSDLPILNDWQNQQARGSYQEATFTSPRHLEQQFAENGFLAEQFQMLIVEVEQVGPIGLLYINFMREGLVRLGLVICQEDHRGKGYGVTATHIITQHLFKNHPLVRIEAETDVENIGAQRVLEKAGFQREGILRNYRYHHGQWRDFVLYSILSDWSQKIPE